MPKWTFRCACVIERNPGIVTIPEMIPAFMNSPAQTPPYSIPSDYARIGRATSLVYAAGAVLVWLAPDTTRRLLED